MRVGMTLIPLCIVDALPHGRASAYLSAPLSTSTVTEELSEREW
jgi:hypothetical protein